MRLGDADVSAAVDLATRPGGVSGLQTTAGEANAWSLELGKRWHSARILTASYSLEIQLCGNNYDSHSWRSCSCALLPGAESRTVSLVNHALRSAGRPRTRFALAQRHSLKTRQLLRIAPRLRMLHDGKRSCSFSHSRYCTLMSWKVPPVDV